VEPPVLESCLLRVGVTLSEVLCTTCTLLATPRWDEDRRANAEAYVRQVAQRLADSGIEAAAARRGSTQRDEHVRWGTDIRATLVHGHSDADNWHARSRHQP